MVLNFPKGPDPNWEEDFDTWRDIEEQCEALIRRVLGLRGTWIGDGVDYALFSAGLLYATTLIKSRELIGEGVPEEAKRVLKVLHEIGSCCGIDSDIERTVYRLAGMSSLGSH